MSSAEERIKELARKNAIDDAAAARLLAAVRPATVGSGSNPFDRWGGGRAIALGVAASLLALALSRAGLRNDGMLDLHHSWTAVPLGAAALDQVWAFPVTAIVFFLAARLVAGKVRVVDLFATVGLARVPAVASSLPLAAFESRYTAATEPQWAAMALVAIVVAGLGLQIYLLVIGFRTATGVRGTRLTLGILGALFAAEVVSKVLVFVTA